VTAALNAAVERILDERSSSSNNKLPRGRMDSLLIEVHRDHNLPDTVTLNQKTVLQRIFRKQTFVSHEQRKGGHVSPLSPIEPYLCDMLIILSKLRHALTPKESIMLINALIDGTPHQIALIEWKQKYAYFGDADKLGEVGPGYFRQFMKRIEELVSARGHKYELDRSNWTTYQNFRQMYSCIEDALIECGVAIKLDKPVWMDSKGDIVSKEDADGMKVAIKIIRPELCLVADKTGMNTCQRGDGRNGGQRKIGGRGCKIYNVVSKRDRHCTLVGFTNLLGKHVLCVIIISGKEDDNSIYMLELLMTLKKFAMKMIRFTYQKHGSRQEVPRWDHDVNSLERLVCLHLLPFTKVVV